MRRLARRLIAVALACTLLAAVVSAAAFASMSDEDRGAQANAVVQVSEENDEFAAYVPAIAVVGVSACSMGWFFHRSAQIDESEKD